MLLYKFVLIYKHCIIEIIIFYKLHYLLTFSNTSILTNLKYPIGIIKVSPRSLHL